MTQEEKGVPALHVRATPYLVPALAGLEPRRALDAEAVRHIDREIHGNARAVGGSR
jgi:hypothetical protein